MSPVAVNVVLVLTTHVFHLDLINRQSSYIDYIYLSFFSVKSYFHLYIHLSYQ